MTQGRLTGGPLIRHTHHRWRWVLMSDEFAAKTITNHVALTCLRLSGQHTDPRTRLRTEAFPQPWQCQQRASGNHQNARSGFRNCFRRRTRRRSSSADRRRFDRSPVDVRDEVGVVLDEISLTLGVECCGGQTSEVCRSGLQ